MRILTANLRKADADDGPHAWPHRRALCAETIRSSAPDVLCVQEMRAVQEDDLLERLPGYSVHGPTKTGACRDRINGIFVRDAAVDVIACGGCWLSETPHVAGSASWGSASIRLLAWVRIIDRATGCEIRILNTHLDHANKRAQREQARMVAAAASAQPEDAAQILTGDFNAVAGSPTLAAFTRTGWRDTWSTAHGAVDPGPTFHGFHGDAWDGPARRIDWVLVRGPLRPRSAAVLRNGRNGRYPSDHYFVEAEVLPAA